VPDAVHKPSAASKPPPPPPAVVVDNDDSSDEEKPKQDDEHDESNLDPDKMKSEMDDIMAGMDELDGLGESDIEDDLDDDDIDLR
jgi:hypothetical protein